MSVLRALPLLALFALFACSSSDPANETRAGVEGTAEPTGQNPFGLTEAECKASPAPAVFGNALCVCGDLNDVGNLHVAAGTDGTLGSVGVNGTSKLIDNANVAGSWANGKELSAIGNVIVGGSLYTPDDLQIAGNMEIGKDLNVGGVMSGIGRLAVKGALGLRGANRLVGYQDIASKGAYADAPDSPCACKGSKGYLDVGAAVDAAKSKSDNAAKKVATSLGNVGFTKLALETGTYYFPGSVKSIGYEHITVKGAVAMYIDGSLDQIGADVFDIADGSTLDLYVRDTVKTIGYVSLGDAKNPSAFRLFVGGGDGISLAIGDQVFHGSIYAPNASLKYIGNTVVEGALFANTFTGIGNLQVNSALPKPAAGCDSAAGANASSGTTRDDGVGTPVIH